MAPHATVTKSSGKIGGVPSGNIGVECRRDDRGVGDEHGPEQESEPDEELDAVDVIPRLKEQPDRKQRRDQGVGKQDQDPLRGRREPEEALRQLDGDDLTR